jgi:AraC-like DNA-binding protein
LTGPANDFATARFSAATVPERDRVAVLRDLFGPVVARLDVAPVGDGPLHFEVAARTVPDLAVTTLVFSPIRIERTRALIADGHDNWSLSCISSPGRRVVQRGSELMPDEGAGTLLSMAEPFVCATVSGIARGTTISVPRKVLAAMVPDLENRFARPLVSDSEALRLLGGYVELLDQRQLATPEARRLVVSQVHDLVALALGAPRDVAEVASARGLRAARLHAIKADIRASLGQQGLSLTAIAARHGVTPRYVQALFEGDGTTFSRFLLDERLARAHRMLCDPLQAVRPVSAIAYAAGFSDLSHFNRAFRRRFAATPSDVRETARRERGN